MATPDQIRLRINSFSPERQREIFDRHGLALDDILSKVADYTNWERMLCRDLGLPTEMERMIKANIMASKFDKKFSDAVMVLFLMCAVVIMIILGSILSILSE
jgi:hypothetical protein